MPHSSNIFIDFMSLVQMSKSSSESNDSDSDIDEDDEDEDEDDAVDVNNGKCET